MIIIIIIELFDFSSNLSCLIYNLIISSYSIETYSTKQK